MDIKNDNLCAMMLFSRFLNNAPDCIRGENVVELSEACGISKEYAYALLLAAQCGLEFENRDRELFEKYFVPAIHRVDYDECIQNPYFKSIDFLNVKFGKCELSHHNIKAYEGFVWDDTILTEDGSILASIGFLEKDFVYPAVLENGRIWMTVTPLEINTMRHAVKKARGKVLAYGLGLGYFAYMAALKEEVSSVTVVDCNEDIIGLFKEYIFPQFGVLQNKIRIVHQDAFEYAEKIMPNEGYDFVFTDLWHDVSDGEELYLKMKKLEVGNSHYEYWIEQSIVAHMKGLE